MSSEYLWDYMTKRFHTCLRYTHTRACACTPSLPVYCKLASNYDVKLHFSGLKDRAGTSSAKAWSPSPSVTELSTLISFLLDVIPLVFGIYFVFLMVLIFLSHLALHTFSHSVIH